MNARQYSVIVVNQLSLSKDRISLYNPVLFLILPCSGFDPHVSRLGRHERSGGGSDSGERAVGWRGVLTRRTGCPMLPDHTGPARIRL